MARERMTSTEIWLRLIDIGELYGERMVLLAQRLQQEGHIDTAMLLTLGLTQKQTEKFFACAPHVIESSLRWLDEPDHHLVCADSPLYPVQLRAISDFPGALFVMGEPAILSSDQLAVVGSRAHSWYGQRWGSLFCEVLVRAGLTITSGLACGIDGIAHRAALAAQGKTVAVLGNGLSSIYPRRHASLAANIVSNGGAVISEFSLATRPWPGNFPQRNRIISGLSRGVFVVEAMLRSGSLVTAKCALEQGRDVFALPGAVGSPGSEGTHWLIKQGATPVTAPEEIVESLRYGLTWLSNQPEMALYSSDQEDVALPFPELLANVGDEVTPVDVVAERAGQPVPVTVAQLLELELAGWIAAVPGGYVRLRRACHVRRTDVFV
mgnify:FL=1